MENTLPTLADLHAGLVRLRASWPNDWVGLPVIVADCLRRLGEREGEPLSATARASREAIASVAVAIEDEGLRRHRQGSEPPYHNRLHIADTLVSMTGLLLATRAEQQRAPDSSPSDAEWVLMLAMLAHDFGHPGKVNQFPGEIERQSFSDVQPLLQAAGVPAQVMVLIGDLILMTDPARVRPHHEAMQGCTFDLDDAGCMAMLLQECDILASAMPDIGIALTHQLASEWSPFSAAMAESLLRVKSRISFLRNQALFSSPASQHLGLSDMTAAEIRQLERAAGDAPL